MAPPTMQSNGMFPAVQRARLAHRGQFGDTAGTVAIGLGADIVWALALDRSVANGRDIRHKISSIQKFAIHQENDCT